MGFFSSRRPEQLEQQLNNDNTVVRVIRSRFVRALPLHFTSPLTTSPVCSTASRRAKNVKFLNHPLPLLPRLPNLMRSLIHPRPGQTHSLSMTLAVALERQTAINQLLHPLYAPDQQPVVSLPKPTALLLMLSRMAIGFE